MLLRHGGLRVKGEDVNRLPTDQIMTANSAPETVTVTTHRVSCDGSSDIPGGAALGHPRVWLEIDEKGWVECGYCDKRFVLKDAHAH
jgi:uncharacterized Zn-finger protein